SSCLPPKLDVDVHLLRTAKDHELDVVTRLLRGDDVDEALDVPDGPAVCLDDQVAARRPTLSLDGDLIRCASQTGLCRTRPSPHAVNYHAAGDREMEQAGDVRLERLPLDSEEGVFHLAVLDQLGDDVADCVDRDREADADVTLTLAAGLDLGVDADN